MWSDLKGILNLNILIIIVEGFVLINFNIIPVKNNLLISCLEINFISIKF